MVKPVNKEQPLRPEPPRREQSTVTLLAQQYLGIEKMPPEALDPTRFRIPKAEKPTMIDRFLDWIGDLLAGRKNVRSNRAEVVRIISKDPLDITADEFERVKTLRPYIPRHFNARFSRWGKVTNEALLAREAFHKVTSDIEKHLRPPEDTASLEALQELLNYCKLGDRYESLKSHVERTRDEIIPILIARFKENPQALIGREDLINLLLTTTVSSEVKDIQRLHEAEQIIKKKDLSQSAVAIRLLSEIAPTSSHYQKATEDLCLVHLDKPNEPSWPVLEERLKGATLPSAIQQRLFTHYLEKNEIAKALLYSDHARPEDLHKLAEQYLKNNETDKAVTYFEKAEERGYKRSAFELGKLSLKDKPAQAADYFEKVAADNVFKRLLLGLSNTQKETVGNALFHKGSYEAAVKWLRDLKTPAALEKTGYAILIQQVANERKDRFPLDEAFEGELPDTPEGHAVLALNKLFLFGKDEKTEDFRRAAFQLTKADKARLVAAAPLINKEIEEFLKKDDLILRDIDAAKEANEVLLSLPDSKVNHERAALLASKYYQLGAFEKASEMLVQADNKASRELVIALLERDDLSASLVAQLALLAHKIKLPTTFMEKWFGKATDPEIAYLAAYHFLTGYTEGASLEPLKLIDNTSVLHKLTPQQLLDLLQLITWKLLPTLPPEALTLAERVEATKGLFTGGIRPPTTTIAAAIKPGPFDPGQLASTIDHELNRRGNYEGTLRLARYQFDEQALEKIARIERSCKDESILRQARELKETIIKSF